MGQKLLLFISIFILNCTSAFADSEGVPPLPTTVVEAKDDSSTTVDKSFFDKAKNFFGFGKEENSEEKKPADEGIVQETPVHPSENITKEETLPKLSQDEIEEMNKNAPASATEEGPLVSYVKEVVKSTPTENTEDDALKLPEGFEDYAKSPEDDMDNEKPDLSPPSDLPVPAEVPSEETPSLPAVKKEKSVELPQTEAVNSIDSAKDKSNAEMDDSNPAKEDMDVPEFPEIPSFDDEAKQPEEGADKDKQIEANEKIEEAPTSDVAKEDAVKEDVVKEDVVKEDVAKEDAVKEDVEVPSVDETKLELPKLPDADGSKPEDSNVEQAKKEELSAETKGENDPLPVPSYANKAPGENESAILKYQQERDAKNETSEILPQISKEELVIGDDIKIKKFSAVRSAELTHEQAKFVNNEAQVLVLPNDDIVLGSITREARLVNMDLRSYLTVFWKNYNKIKREPKRMEIERFIDEYDENFNEEDSLYSNDQSEASLNEAFKTIDKREVYSLIGFVNNYQIIHLSGAGDNNLLHEAAYIGNYPAAKFLVLKGIDLLAKNDSGNSALSVSKIFGQKHITSLLKSAGAK